MTRSTGALARRRSLAATALAALAVTLTAGCGAGQQAQTAAQVPTVPGANKEIRVPDPEGGRLIVRNAVVAYSSTGYAKGATVPLELALFNDTGSTVRLVGVTSPDGQVQLVRGASPAPGETASPSPTATRSPAPAGGPVNLELPARGYVLLSPTDGQFLQLVGLSKDLRLGHWVTLTFQFNNNATMADVMVPLNTPTSPVPRSPMVFKEEEGGPVGHEHD